MHALAVGATCPTQLPAEGLKQLLLHPWTEEAKRRWFAAWLPASASLVGSVRCVSVQSGHCPCVSLLVVMEGLPQPTAKTPRALCSGKAAQDRLFLRKGFCPELSLSFLPFC